MTLRLIPMSSNPSSNTVVLLSLALSCLQWHLMNATSTLRDYHLRISCSEDYCPNEQCWKVNATNPFQTKAKRRVVFDAQDAGRVWIKQPNDTRVEETSTLGRFEVKTANGSDLNCVEGGLTEFFELCISNAATATPPHVEIQHQQGPEHCPDRVYHATGRKNDACKAQCIPPCYCPSSEAPIKDPPQFIVVTWDDAFTHEEYREHLFELLHSNKDVRDYCGGYPRHTFFVTDQHTNYAALSHFLQFGAEYALHTVVHEDRKFAESAQYWSRQIEGGLRWAERLVPSVRSTKAFTPTGFRAPWLAHNDALYQALNATRQITYDSSLPSFSRPIWPYTLDFGAHEGCSYYDASGVFYSCPTAGKFPGVWEFPINPLLSKAGEVLSFDPTGSALEILHLLKDHLRHSYEDNRAPMMLSLHSQEFFKHDAQQRKRILRNFFLTVQHEYAAVGKKVVFANMRQIIDWMKSGTPQSTKEEFCDYFKLPHAEVAPSPKNTEICDGWDNDGDEQYDEFVVNKCTYLDPHSPFPSKPTELHLYTCASCPHRHPTDGGPRRNDDGRNGVWRGRLSTIFEFFDMEDGSVGFSVKIRVRNGRGFPTQGWYLRLKTRGLFITSYYGVDPSTTFNHKLPPPISILESLPENRIIGSFGVIEDIQIGGIVQTGRDDCIGESRSFLEPHCWRIEAFLTEDTFQTL